MQLEVLIRECGIIGIVASLGVLVADLFIYGRSDSFESLPPLKRAAGLPLWRLNTGNALGIGLIPFVALGFVPLFYALLPSGFFMAFIVTGLFVYFFGMGPGAHASTVDHYLLHRAREKYSINSPETNALDSVISEQGKIYDVLVWLVRVPLLLGSLVYSVLVLMGNTCLPVWMAIINPFVLIGFAISSERWMPSTIAGYLYPIKVYVGIIPLQLLTLIYMWNGM
ncbi:MAG: DUF6796 family protein [Candidatus Odinarchaeota archaeon]